MAIALAPVTSAPCACGSGLVQDRCCGLDWAAADASPAPPEALAQARAALTRGETADGARRLLEVLAQHPLDLAALRLLRDLRASEGAMAAALALLSRIVRLDPNDLAATQALALALFNRGALAEAEVHARNAVRLAPLDVQSHNLMGMILTELQRPQV